MPTTAVLVTISAEIVAVPSAIFAVYGINILYWRGSDVGLGGGKSLEFSAVEEHPSAFWTPLYRYAVALHTAHWALVLRTQ